MIPLSKNDDVENQRRGKNVLFNHKKRFSPFPITVDVHFPIYTEEKVSISLSLQIFPDRHAVSQLICTVISTQCP